MYARLSHRKRARCNGPHLSSSTDRPFIDGTTTPAGAISIRASRSTHAPVIAEAAWEANSVGTAASLSASAPPSPFSARKKVPMAAAPRGHAHHRVGSGSSGNARTPAAATRKLSSDRGTGVGASLPSGAAPRRPIGQGGETGPGAGAHTLARGSVRAGLIPPAAQPCGIRPRAR